MKLQPPPCPARQAGSVLVVTLLISMIIGITLAAFMDLSSAQHRAVIRSGVWNSCIPIAESGLAGYDLNTWHGWLGPAGLSPIIANKMSVELGKVVRFPQIAEQLKDDGGEAVGSTPEEFRQLIASESVRWRKVAAANNISVD